MSGYGSHDEQQKIEPVRWERPNKNLRQESCFSTTKPPGARILENLPEQIFTFLEIYNKYFLILFKKYNFYELNPVPIR